MPMKPLPQCVGPGSLPLRTRALSARFPLDAHWVAEGLQFCMIKLVSADGITNFLIGFSVTLCYRTYLPAISTGMFSVMAL